MQKLDRMCMNRLMFVLFRLDVPPIARKIFSAKLMASLAAALLREAPSAHIVRRRKEGKLFFLLVLA